MYNEPGMLLRLVFLGGFSVQLAEKPFQAFESDKVRALLAFLAMEANQHHRRDTLTGLLWPELPERAARHNLSQAIYSLGQQIKKYSETSPFAITPRAIGFYINHQIWVDAHHFQSIIEACETHSHHGAAICQICMERLLEAIDLYRGDFLAGLTLKGCERFDEWLRHQRQRMHFGIAHALERVSLCFERKNNFDRAAEYARRWVAQDPFNETSHRQLMRNLANQGLRSEALAQYETCRALLAQELNTEPDSATTTLFNEIQSLSPRQQSAQPAHNLPTAPTPLIGRNQELEQIYIKLDDPTCHLLTLVGPGGIGKTRLALEAAYGAMPAFKDGGYLVELQPQGAANSILLAIVKAANLGILAETETARPSIHRGLKDQIFDHLRGKNLLLILDGFESHLDEAAVVGELLRHAPEMKIIVTSRSRLNLEIEHIIPVEGLRFPPGTALKELHRVQRGAVVHHRRPACPFQFST
jgi:DNA-binding SARP family transcriptional activator